MQPRLQEGGEGNMHTISPVQGYNWPVQLPARPTTPHMNRITLWTEQKELKTCNLLTLTRLTWSGKEERLRGTLERGTNETWAAFSKAKPPKATSCHSFCHRYPASKPIIFKALHETYLCEHLNSWQMICMHQPLPFFLFSSQVIIKTKSSPTAAHTQGHFAHMAHSPFAARHYQFMDSPFLTLLPFKWRSAVFEVIHLGLSSPLAAFYYCLSVSTPKSHSYYCHF